MVDHAGATGGGGGCVRLWVPVLHLGGDFGGLQLI